MKLTKKELQELVENGCVEVWTGQSGSEDWVFIEVEE